MAEILSIDLGTTYFKVSLFDRNGRLCDLCPILPSLNSERRKELIKIYHADAAVPDLQPARIGAADVAGMDLSADDAKAVLASKPVA
jgi:hypothetical protein